MPNPFGGWKIPQRCTRERCSHWHDPKVSCWCSVIMCDAPGLCPYANTDAKPEPKPTKPVDNYVAVRRALSALVSLVPGSPRDNAEARRHLLVVLHEMKKLRSAVPTEFMGRTLSQWERLESWALAHGYPGEWRELGDALAAAAKVEANLRQRIADLEQRTCRPGSCCHVENSAAAATKCLEYQGRIAEFEAKLKEANWCVKALSNLHRSALRLAEFAGERAMTAEAERDHCKAALEKIGKHPRAHGVVKFIVRKALNALLDRGNT